MAKKQKQTKKAGRSRKSPKVDAAVPATWPESKPKKARERDPRLPAAGTVIVRTYKGKDHRVKVLADSFELDGTSYRSLTALARAVTGYAAISGPAWLGITKETAASPKKDAAKESDASPATTRAPKRAAKVRRAGRDPQPVTPKEAAPESAPASETPTA
jgi:hypothetical protein